MNKRLTKVIFLSLTGLFFFSSCFVCYGQNIFRIRAYRDSLRSTSRAMYQVKLLNKIAFEFKSSFPDSTINYSKRAAVLAAENSYTLGSIDALNYQGIANAFLGKIDLALRQHNEAIGLSLKVPDSLHFAHSKNFLGRLHLQTGNLAEAFENIAQARLVFEQHKNIDGMAQVYLSLSDLFKSQHDYSNGLEMVTQAIALTKGLDDQSGIIASLNVLAELHKLTGDFSQAETNYRDAESRASEIEDEAELALVKLGLAELYIESGSLSRAESEAFRAENIITRITNPSLLSRSTLLLGRIFLKKKNYAQAESYFTKTLEVSSLLKQLNTFMEVNFYMARLYELTGRDAGAAIYEAQYRVLNDSIKNNELALQAEKFNFQLNIEKKDQENALLKATEQRNVATIRFQQTINFGALLVIVLILLFSYFLWRGSRARRKINKKLYIQNDQLKNLNQEKDALMGIVAHDLKTPLSNIKSILGVLPTFGSLSPKQQEFTNLIQTSSDAGLDLIDELLDVHNLETQSKATYKMVRIQNLVNTRISQFSSSAAAKNIKLTADAVENNSLQTDADWLGRILDNLISNAIKFSPSDKEIKVSSGAIEAEIWISIVDQGQGFSDEDKKKIFQKFKKLSAKPTGHETSNGLGLSIVKTLVERLNGTISLLSSKGEGSEFIIRLPIAPIN